ncbi:MAG TPA: diguanylate cyclase, partial [Nitrospiria bacterium]|nr:diguanylate cyclase [Nitrospiria bacterium]
RLIWWSGYLSAWAILVKKRLRKGNLTSPDVFGFLVLLLLLNNVLTQLTGGIQSFLLPLYPVFILIASLRLGRNAALCGAVISIVLESGNLYHHPSDWKEAILYPPLLLAIPIVVRGYLDIVNRERDLLRRRVDRIEGEMGLLEASSEIQVDVEANRLSQEEREGEALSLARQMATAMGGLLRVAYEAASAVPPAFTPSPSTDKLFESTPELHAGVVLLLDRDQGGVWATASVGPGEALLQKEKLIPLREEGSGVLGWFIKEKRTLSVSNFDRQRGGPGYYARPVPIASVLVVPLIDGESVEGLLCFDSLSPGFFSAHHERLIEGISLEMVFLLRIYRERQQVLRTAREFSVLLGISRHLSSRLDLTHRLLTTAVEAKKIVQYDQCFIFLVEKGERRAVVKVANGYDPKIIDYSFGLTNGLLSILVKNRQPLLFSDLSASRRMRIFPDGCRIDASAGSLLGIPLVVEERAIGVVLFLSASQGRFTAYHQHILTLLCGHVALSIAEAQLHSQVEHLATVDGLTGTFNHRRFQERLQEEFIRTHRHPDAFSFLMIDIDHFKKVNDTYGHPAGDAVLRTIAKTLIRLVRKTDLVARYGGEEFAILLLKATSEQAERLAERIRKTIEERPIPWEGITIPVTVSIGAASYPNDADNRESLILRADRALYASKNGGRNRVTVYSKLRP